LPAFSPEKSSRKFVRLDEQRTLINVVGSSKLFLAPPNTRKKKYPKNDGGLPGESNDFDVKRSVLVIDK